MLGHDEKTKASMRVIIHLDLDCFYAQVEQRRLKIPNGEPVAVQQWGSLLAVNYEARKFGVERGDIADDAKKKCPQIYLPHVDTLGENRNPGQAFDRIHQKAILRRYRVASREIFGILRSMVPVIEKAGIDEAFMDVTEMAVERLSQMTVFSSDFCQDPANHDTKVFCKVDGDETNTVQAFPLTDSERLFCIGAAISREIRQAVYSKLGYTCSTGIAGNKLLAKLASPLNKPNGQVVVASRFISALMKSLPMRKVRGLGGKLGKQLESIYNSLELSEALDQKEQSAKDISKKLTAHAFFQRCGLAELSKHVGHETAVYVHSICQGNDGDEPVEDKKVQIKMLSCVKQFDQRSGSALVRVEQLEYWVRLLCEEIIIRCEDERIENKRFPLQLTIQTTGAKPDEKPCTRKLSIAQDTTVDELFTAAMNVMRLHLDSIFPLAALSMHAKNFYDLDTQAISTISSFFMRNTDMASSSKVAAQRVEEEITQFTAKRSRGDTACGESSRQKISSLFGSSASGSSSNSTNKKEAHLMSVTPSNSCIEATSTYTQAETALSSSSNHFCDKCQYFVSEPEDEHADFHFALNLSRVQHREVMMDTKTIQRPLQKKKKRGPLDKFWGQ